jgi:hypothetical protein
MRPSGQAAAVTSLAELLDEATERQPLEAPDGKSGTPLERIVLEGQAYVLKYLEPDGDWLARAAGDRDGWPGVLYRCGLLDRLPGCLDHAIVGCLSTDEGGAVLVMRDVSPFLVPPGHGALPWGQHRRFLHHMAALHAAFWEFEDTLGLLRLADRYRLLSPDTVRAEVVRGGTHPIPTGIIPRGWEQLARCAPQAHAHVVELLADPAPLVEALATTPTTLVHGDWKAGNLGTGPDGRTILLDWALPGAAPGCVDLGHYLALNAVRLPEAREGSIAAYRRALAVYGVNTNGWWERQLQLCLLGTFLMFGWEKALGDSAELAWWLRQVDGAMRWLP